MENEDSEGEHVPSALFLVCLQNDFCLEEGAMSIEDGEELIPKVNKIRRM